MAPSRRRTLALAAAVAATALAASPAGPRRTPASAAPADTPPPTPALFDPTVVRGYAFQFASPNWEAELAATGEDGNVKADLTVEGETYEEIGVRYKGLSSVRVQGRKKPFNVSLDAFVPGQRLLGYDTVNLNNGFFDPSFVREALMYRQLADHMPAPQTAFARLDINGSYFALYLAAEQIERTFLDRWFPGSDGILIKGDPPAFNPPGPAPRPLDEDPLRPQQGLGGLGADLTWRGEDPTAYARFYEVKTKGATTEGLTRIRDLARVLDAPVAAGGVSDADFPAAIGKVLDVDRALWYIAANNLFANFDSYYFSHNYFLYWSEADARFHFLVWDTNLSFGAFAFPGPTPPGPLAQADPFHMSTDRTRPLIRRLLAVPELRADYIAHYRTLRDGAFDPARLEAAAVAMHDLIRPHVQADPNALFPFDQFERNLREDIVVGAGMGARTTPGVLKLARDRHAWLTAHPTFQSPDHTLADHARSPEQPGADEAATIRLRFAGADAPTAVRVVYQVEAGPPASVELAADGDAWVGTLPGQAPGRAVTYYARVAFADGRSAFHPAANLTQPWRYTVASPDLPLTPGGALVINELMADNETTLADPAGELEDWVELYNRGDAPVRLAGHFLGEDAVDPWAYALPDATLAPGERLLIWCDSDPDQGPDHAPFRLSKAGGQVRLSTRTATLDVVEFGPQAPDHSFARLPDGGEAWVDCPHATPRQANRCDAPPTATPVLTAMPTPDVRDRRLALPLVWNARAGGG
ncbi:hypothetical protein DCC79_09935 [bacterium]|nr:MAG: hypothetical protein DCC79_09935 [bacterium]